MLLFLAVVFGEKYQGFERGNVLAAAELAKPRSLCLIKLQFVSFSLINNFTWR